MDRLVLIALFVAAAGCSDATGSNDNSSNSNGTPNSANGTPNSANGTPNNVSNPRPDLVESPDCFAEPARENFTMAEYEYTVATEAPLLDARISYGSTCGSAMAVDIDWESTFASVGFDDDELSDPGAVTDAVLPFLTAAQAFCYSGNGSGYRETVLRVAFIPTDTPDRVGLCLDDVTGALVSRFMLTPDEGTATQWTETEVTAWLTDNLP